MGQKIHPHGLRVGINRKWNSSWFETTKNWKSLFFYQKQIEDFFKNFFYFYPYTRNSITKRVLLIDLKLFKYNARTLFLFIFFYKLRTKRRPKRLKTTINFGQAKVMQRSTFDLNFQKKRKKTLLLNNIALNLH
jgi:hypothetical protein